MHPCCTRLPSTTLAPGISSSRTALCTPYGASPAWLGTMPHLLCPKEVHSDPWLYVCAMKCAWLQLSALLPQGGCSVGTPCNLDIWVQLDLTTILQSGSAGCCGILWAGRTPTNLAGGGAPLCSCAAVPLSRWLQGEPCHRAMRYAQCLLLLLLGSVGTHSRSGVSTSPCRGGTDRTGADAALLGLCSMSPTSVLHSEPEKQKRNGTTGGVRASNPSQAVRIL